MSGLEFTDRAQNSIGVALQLAKDHLHPQVAPVHLALALLTDDTNNSQGNQSTNPASESLFKSICSKAGVDASKLEEKLRTSIRKLPQQTPLPDDVSLSSATIKILKQADHLKKTQRDSFIAQDHLLLALIEDSTIKTLLKEAGLANENLIKTAITQSRGGRHIDSKSAEAGYDALGKYCTDLTALAAEGSLDPVIGRDNEIRRTVRILSRRTKNNAVLIGPPGVGKTAIVEGLAQRVVDRDVPPNLLGKILSLDMGALMAGAKYKGEYEERVKSVLSDIEKMTNDGTPCILFIDEMHLLMTGQGAESGSMDAANLLKPMLARGKLRVVGCTTLAEYRKYIEKDAALERRFQTIMVQEPTVEDCIAILRGIRDKYEVHHGVRILDAAIVSAAQLAKRYLGDRRLPDSAIDLVDEACADVRVSRETVPEEVDKLERKKLQLEIAVHALEREKDQQSKEALLETKKQITAIEDELGPIKAAYEAQKQKGDEINLVRRKIEEIKAKAAEAERRYDLATASDLKFYALPDLEARLKHLQDEERKREEEGKDHEGNSVTSDAIAAIVSRWTGIPVSRMLESERAKLLKLESTLAREVIGQEDAVKSVAQAIRLSRSGLSDSERPIASFLFAGSSGSGKTLLSRTLAKCMFDSPDAMVRIDASEFSEKHSISRLIGAPPGYVGYEEGGILTEAVRRRPFSIVLIDEIEKAAKEFITLLLGVIDAGRLTDSQGRLVSFKNCIIIMTSNLGSAYINDSETLDAPTRQLVNSAILAHFPPEFVNRIDSIVIFNKLNRADVRRIVDVRIKEVQKRIDANGGKCKLDLNEGAKDYLASIGFSPTMGARPLQRCIQQEVLSPLSILILSNQINLKEDERIEVVFDPHRNGLVVKPNHEATAGTELMDDEEMSDDFNDLGNGGARIEDEPLD
ncbi:putative heat shock protein HSP104 [Violaceomyces palustris]|uniref:Heat shock protein HSP104 n=1 Tax=Violaceomyces palustris TaxID=1673888 RepID=A0ACD0P2A1_9BASI|nr:putative heat shock protein HSP104 [Violaceomyces palustris]